MHGTQRKIIILSHRLYFLLNKALGLIINITEFIKKAEQTREIYDYIS